MSPSSKTEGRNSPKKVLVVEDLPEAMFVMVAAVHELGYSVYPAADGVEALTLIKNGLMPDLILLDLHMPRMNGIQFYNNLRSIPGAEDVPIILISSDELTADLVIALNLFGHAHKGTSRDNLRTLIKSALTTSPGS